MGCFEGAGREIAKFSCKGVVGGSNAETLRRLGSCGCEGWSGVVGMEGLLQDGWMEKIQVY